MQQTNEQIARQYADSLPTEQLPWELESMNEAREAVYKHALAMLNLRELSVATTVKGGSTYEQRVRHRAEELARCIHSNFNKWPRHARDNRIFELFKAARLSVQREAEAYKAAWWDNGEPHGSEAAYQSQLKILELKLQSLGLVPSNQ